MKDDIFLILKGWVSPMENSGSNALGYRPNSYVKTEEEAKKFCENAGLFTAEDCWAVSYEENGVMQKYAYKRVGLLEAEGGIND